LLAYSSIENIGVILIGMGVALLGESSGNQLMAFCGIAGALLHMAVEALREKGISPAYLVTDHTGFYERYGWEFLCMVQGDGEPDMTRMYIHR